MFSRSILVRPASVLTTQRTATLALSFPTLRKTMSSGVPSETAKIQDQANASSASYASYGIKNTNINAATGVNLSDDQKVIVGSVLDVRISC